MTSLQQLMDKHGIADAEVARAVNRSRCQISRLRRGVTVASHETALKLEALTGIPWWKFVDLRQRAKRGRARFQRESKGN